MRLLLLIVGAIIGLLISDSLGLIQICHPNGIPC